MAAALLAGCSFLPSAVNESKLPGWVSSSSSTSTTGASTPTARASTTTTGAVTSGPAPPPRSGRTCHYRTFPDGAIGADPNCTPGALNPAAIADPPRTICRHRYLGKLEAAYARMQGLKVELLIRYKSVGNPSTYVLAQRVPAEDGGSPTDLSNLWPMPLEGWGGALTESAVANALHEQICEGRETVRQAAQVLEGDWLRRGIPDDD